MWIIILGIIVIGAGVWVAIGLGDGVKIRRPFMDEPGSPIKPRHYEKSEDGKVVYLYKQKRDKDGADREKKESGGDSQEKDTKEGDDE
jgi:hypothetical protein